MSLLQVAYVFDILVSLPIVLIPLIGSEAAVQWLFGGQASESRSTRMLIGCLWLAILSCLVVGVAFPIAMSPVLILQLIYKSLWIVFFAVPRWLGGKREEVSGKLACVFLVYIAVYPWLIPWTEIAGAG